GAEHRRQAPARAPRQAARAQPRMGGTRLQGQRPGACPAGRDQAAHRPLDGRDAMTAFFDALETRDPAERERALMAALPRQLAHAKASRSAFAELRADVAPAAIASRTALAALPVTRKPELLARQQAHRAADALGGYSAIGWGASLRGARK